MKHFFFFACCLACSTLHAQTRTESIFFDHNQAVIRAADEIILLDIIETLNEYESYTIRLFGNTDAVGSNAYNQKLSQRRVEVVQQFLLQHGVNQSVMQLAAQGESNPAADNVTETGKQRNRRTDIVVQYKLKSTALTAVKDSKKGDIIGSEPLKTNIIRSEPLKTDIIRSKPLKTDIIRSEPFTIEALRAKLKLLN
jgi:hypothetical protein